MFEPVIHTYTRAEALADGVLFDCGDLAREAGFTWPVAVSQRLYSDYLTPSPDLIRAGASFTGRLWDVLTVLRYAIKNSKADCFLRFTVLVLMSPDTAPVPIELVSVAGPDDDGSPCITIMLPDED